MTFPAGAVPVWFGKNHQNDHNLLKEWKDAPLTYRTVEEFDPQWNVDRYEIILGNDPSGKLFERAARLALRNQFYPPEVLTSVSDFLLENRDVQVGDRVLQRIRVFQYNTLPVMEVLTLNEITSVVNEPRRAGFTYTTTEAHSELGEWSPVVEWRENGEVALVIDVVSRAKPGASPLSGWFTRKMQLRAHKLSVENFQRLLLGRALRFDDLEARTSAAWRAIFARLAPVGVVLVGMALAGALLRRGKK